MSEIRDEEGWMNEWIEERGELIWKEEVIRIQRRWMRVSEVRKWNEQWEPTTTTTTISKTLLRSTYCTTVIVDSLPFCRQLCIAQFCLFSCFFVLPFSCSLAPRTCFPQTPYSPFGASTRILFCLSVHAPSPLLLRMESVSNDLNGDNRSLFLECLWVSLCSLCSFCSLFMGTKTHTLRNTDNGEWNSKTPEE